MGITVDSITKSRLTPLNIVLIAVVLVMTALSFYDGLSFMVERWLVKEEYSHGFLLPLIAFYFLWKKKGILKRQTYTGSYLGVLLVVGGVLACLMGELATLFVLIQYGFVLTLAGLILSVTGINGFRHFIPSIVVLFFMVPLPNFIYNSLSSELQLISSRIGVEIIQMFNIPVYLEGNVIDLGPMKLQVVEACSGLRYLFPMITLAFIMAYAYQGALYLRVIIFLSSIPITILMNSFRIGLIGVTVEYFGLKAAQGVLHDFEGWVVFMSSLFLMFLEIILLARLTGDRRPLADLINIDQIGVERHGDEGIVNRAAQTNEEHKGEIKLRLPFQLSAVFILGTLVAVTLLPNRQEIIPEHKSFGVFPMKIDEWQGRRNYIQPVYLQELKLTDYVLADYRSVDHGSINLYTAYYDHQKKGRSAHSPKSCIPGDGWEIKSFEQQSIALNDQASIGVNQVIISKGEQTSLVYYWFQQRGRIITNEYLVKFYLMWDALTQNRTDGAMIRLTTSVFENESVSGAKDRLNEFVKQVSPILDQHIPD